MCQQIILCNEKERFLRTPYGHEKRAPIVVPLDKRSRRHISFKPVFSYNAKKLFYVNMKLLLKTAKSREEKKSPFEKTA